MDIKAIAIGVINSTKAKYGNPDPQVEELATKRMEICMPCDRLYVDTLGPRCGVCNCVLAWLTRSPKKCKIGKWDNI